MFQTFSDTSAKHLTPERIARLRAELKRLAVDGFIVPRADEFQGEYVPPHAERLGWLTGFSGSAGEAVILAGNAAIFVDGRYTLQVREQVDTSLVTPLSIPQDKPGAWAAENLPRGGKLAYDPWLVTVKSSETYRTALEAAGHTLVPLEANPIDAVWQDQPAPPSAPVVAQPLQFAGESVENKIATIVAGLKQRKSDTHVLTQTDAVAWTFNIRGCDIAHTPVPLAFALVHADGSADLVIGVDRVSEDVKEMLGANVRLHDRSKMAGLLQDLGRAHKTVELDKAWAADAIRMELETAGATVAWHESPCTLPRATKNPTELEGARAAHLRDGVPMARFLRWLDEEIPAGNLDEVKAAQQLEALRTETGELQDISFDTISGSGPHAAIPHYRVNETSNLPLKPDQIYLVDSGAQYIDGTTDITRTVIAGTPSAEMKDRFTRVLKGMIQLSRVRFPPGTTGGNLDVLARLALWEAGLDFDHGTGHGVGSYLSVHEGPQRFSKADNTVLQPGMILSNEPGYYKAGEYGIRIENLVVVREAEAIEGGDRPMHWLETITFAPIDRKLVDPAIMSHEDLDWLNRYHADVLKKIGPRLDNAADIAWLEAACAPISREAS
jgi:Xaa-Pro aminopeptidase